jgi:hypothetical protein
MSDGADRRGHNSREDRHPHVVPQAVDDRSSIVGMPGGGPLGRPQTTTARLRALCTTVDDTGTVRSPLTWEDGEFSTIPRTYYHHYPSTHRFLFLNREGTAG